MSIFIRTSVILKDLSSWIHVCRSSGPTSLLKQGLPPAHGAKLHPDGPWISSEGDSSLGNLLGTLLYHSVKKIFLMFRWNFVEFPVYVSISSCPLGWHHQEEPGFFLLVNPPLDTYLHTHTDIYTYIGSGFSVSGFW